MIAIYAPAGVSGKNFNALSLVPRISDKLNIHKGTVGQDRFIDIRDLHARRLSWQVLISQMQGC